MPEWLIPVGIGVVIVGLVGVIFGLTMARLRTVEESIQEKLSREEHEKLCAVRNQWIERMLTKLDSDQREKHENNVEVLRRIESKIDANDKEATDRRHDMYGRLDEICQRLALMEGLEGDPRLRKK